MSGIVPESVMVVDLSGDIADESFRRIYLPHNVLITGYRLGVASSNGVNTLTSLYREGDTSELLFSATIVAGDGISTIHTQAFDNSLWGNINAVRSNLGEYLTINIGYEGPGSEVSDMVVAISYTGTWR
jgi:hypothetical protein